MHRAYANITISIGLLLVENSLPAQAPRANDVFARFCELDSQGAQLTPDGWEQITALFVNPGAPRHRRIILTDALGGPNPATPDGTKIAVGRDYIRLGWIDLPQLRFHPEDHGLKVIELMHLVTVSGADGGRLWRIEGPVPDPLLPVAAAVRYVSEIRAKTNDSGIKRQADRTIEALRHLR